MAGGARPEVAVRLERQLDAAQQITHIGSWEWDVATNAVTWSDEMYRIYGLEPRSIPLSFDSFIARVHPDDREAVKQDIGAALQRGHGRFAHRERIIRPDGSVRELDTVGEVLCDPAGRTTGLIGTCRDVTEERRREETIRLYADIVDHVQIGLSVWRIDDPTHLAGLRLVAYNPATETATGVSLTGCIGKTLAAIFPSAMATELPALLAGVSANNPVRELAEYRFSPEGTAGPCFAVKAFVLPDHCVGLALEDITARYRAEQLQAGERIVLEMLAAGAPLSEILTVVVRLIEELSPDVIASILVLDETGTHLWHGAAPSLPAEFIRAIDGTAIGPRAGSCGTAAHRRETVIVADVATDPLWTDYRHLALPHGLRSCWSTPLLGADGRVLGTFAIYHREPRVPDDAARQLVARAAHVASIALERRHLDDQLRALSERVEAAREEERTGIAREIHDVLGQALTALKMDLAWVSRRLGDRQVVATKLGEMTRDTDEVIQSVRRISAELRPGALDDLGLRAAIEWQAEEFERRTGTRCEVRSTLGDLRLDRGLATDVFRIFQEALTNVARHARATHVLVELGLREGQVVLQVADDGVGLPPVVRGVSLGLLGMRERARRKGGECVIRSREPRGTLVSVTVPLKFPAERRTDTDSE